MQRHLYLYDIVLKRLTRMLLPFKKFIEPQCGDEDLNERFPGMKIRHPNTSATID